MKRKLAIIIAETILYIETVLENKESYGDFFIKITSLPFNKKDLKNSLPFYIKELNNIKNIINHYYKFVTVSFVERKHILDKESNLDMHLTFNFRKEV